MKIITSIVFYFILFLTPFGLLGYYDNYNAGLVVYAFSSLGISIYFLIKSIRILLNKHKNSQHLWIPMLISISSILVFLKYTAFTVADIPSIIIIPLFIIYGSIYLLLFPLQEIKQSLTILIILITTIPLFTKPFYHSPRRLIPTHWYSRYNAIKIEPDISTFYYPQTIQLVNDAKHFRSTFRHKIAIETLHQAIKYEPTNSYLYFELGQTYADDNKIDKGIAYLDTSILFMNDNFYGYNCRGIMNRAIRNYEKALADFNTAAAIDSTNGVAFANIAGVYCDIKDYSSALKFVKKAELNNFDIYSVKAFQNLIRNHTKEEIFKTSTTFPPNND